MKFVDDLPIYRQTVASPLGELIALASESAICVLHMAGAKHAPDLEQLTLAYAPHLPIFTQLTAELAEYFAGARHTFTLPLAPAGTAFQRAAWAALTAIPYGATCTYADQAAALNKPRAVRAVGGANGRNPIGILIPCHRVVGANGTLTGYAGGVDKKALLLRLEASGQARVDVPYR
jgi:methylated-DNA-[protein]-cysteine S-methyltransferase